MSGGPEFGTRSEADDLAERVERFRTRKAREIASPLAAELAIWGESAAAAVELQLIENEGLADEGQPLASLDDRAWEQAWEPLVAIASKSSSLSGTPLMPSFSR